ncbi:MULTISPECIES: ERCC4 domain-containing protein [unclassified Luteococcus]|uniref:ERCC4 domain-containing protein n=1 Tax=unclassified Luteococcus TaxID=2639923 RepID=UPI00313B54F9
MALEMRIARNPEQDTSLPYLVWLPLGDGLVLKTNETWPRTGKLYCHPAPWPQDPEILETLPVISCNRRGAAIDLVLARGREKRSQFVMTRVRGGREAIFWQTQRTAKQARPMATVPAARASGQSGMEILIDSHERYAWKFSSQQATTRKAPLRAGDYAVQTDGQLVAAVERKSLEDLTSSLLSGKLSYQLAELASLPRAALVVEDRYSSIFKLTHARPAQVADQLGECQVRFPHVPIIFAETRQLAQEWTYRFFGAALAEQEQEGAAAARLSAMPPVPEARPSAAIAEDERRVSPQQAAQILGISRPTLLKILDRGEIPYERVGRNRRIRMTALLAYQQTREPKGE